MKKRIKRFFAQIDDRIVAALSWRSRFEPVEAEQPIGEASLATADAANVAAYDEYVARWFHPDRLYVRLRNAGWGVWLEIRKIIVHTWRRIS